MTRVEKKSKYARRQLLTNPYSHIRICGRQGNTWISLFTDDVEPNAGRERTQVEKVLGQIDHSFHNLKIFASNILLRNVPIVTIVFTIYHISTHSDTQHVYAETTAIRLWKFKTSGSQTRA